MHMSDVLAISDRLFQNLLKSWLTIHNDFCNQGDLMICLVITNRDFYGHPIMGDKF